jgi:transcriptional regulator with XRE-family HTH domain
MVMNNTEEPVGAILAELAARLRTERLNQNMTQRDLADRAGTSTDTVRSIETGGNVTLAVLVKVLRGLGMDERLYLLVPSAAVSPIEVAKRDGRVRKRATGARTVGDDAEWRFVDAPDGRPPGTA